MALAPSYVINTVDQTALLNIFVDEMLATSYSFENFQVTLTERTMSVDISLENLKINLEAIIQWLSLIQSSLLTQKVAYRPYSIELIKDDTTYKAEFSLDGVKVSDVTYTYPNSIITFDGRPEVTMELNEFRLWNDFLNTIYISIRDFN